MPEGCLSFAISATPGGSARDLRMQLAAMTAKHLPKEPALVCVMAPCNNLTASRTVDEAAEEFGQLLRYVCGRWPKVCVVDFPPRLAGSVEIQTLLRQEYHRVSARFQVNFVQIADHFPRHRRELWCRDGIHLSDSHGMGILVQLLWQACYTQLEVSSPASSVAAPRPRTSTRRVSPRVVVTGPLPVPRPQPPPSEFIKVVRGRKNQPRDSASPVGPKGRLVQREVETVFSIPLSPVLFSPAMLVEMDARFPFGLTSSVEDVATFPSGKKTSRARRRKAASSKKRQPKRQVGAAPVVVEVRPGSPSSFVPAVEEDQAEGVVVEVTPGSSPTSVAILDSFLEDQAEAVVVEVTPGTSPTSVIILDTFLEDESGDVEVTPGTSLASSRDQMLMDEAMDISPPVTPLLPPLTCPLLTCHPSSSVTSQPSLLSPPPAVHEERASDKDKSCCAHVVPVGVPSVVRGSFHQGDFRFEYAGVQCMAIALVALAKHSVCNVFSWDQRQLDLVLNLGDALYTDRRNRGLTHGRDLLIASDLPRESVIDGQQFSFSFSQPVNGAANVVEHEFIEAGAWVTLDGGLEQMLAQYDTCLMTLCGAACAVIKDNGRYAVVDSHSRSAEGLVDPDGKSVVMYFSHIDELYSFFCTLAACYGDEESFKEFELTGVNVVVAADSVRGLKCQEAAEVSSVLPDKYPKQDIEVVSDSVRGLKCQEAAEVSSSVLPDKNTNQDMEVDLDVLFTSVQDSALSFNPLNESVCKDLCKHIKAEFQKLGVADPKTVGPLGVPCEKDKIVADGNCFFRAVSQAISGTQKYHRKIRLATVKQLEKNPSKYNTLLRDGHFSVEQYISVSNMRKVGTWATEVEIHAAADYLGVDIFTFYNGHWLKYGCTTEPVSNGGIYLENINSCHYENVICVKMPDANACYECCQVYQFSMEGYNIRPKKVALKPPIDLDNQIDIKPKLSKYVQKKKLKHLKHTYIKHHDTIKEKQRTHYITHHTHVKDASKKRGKQKYRDDSEYREGKKAASKHSYRMNEFYRQKKKAAINVANKQKYRTSMAFRENLKSTYKTEDLDEVHEQMESGEIHEDAWGLLCPEQEVERLESREEFREMLQAVGSEQEQEAIPDLAQPGSPLAQVLLALTPSADSLSQGGYD
ncbi:uncharacterized protein LOC117373730 [Periophthalmus magnuspinnatus]|uniref:uncharacterized protein LOC117373730 n=1 Tax=Periophthalmus magnuspinnatus TaxID=409849 RepID=UPI0024363B68|nr:uncharacterized protein LOC117373730 [Periophthalmus magnuspinnatus]